MTQIDFTDRVAVITGGAGGIGRAICEIFVARGIRCVLVDIDTTRLEAACRMYGPRAEPFAADLTRQADIDRLEAHLRHRFGRLDILVNNAAMTSTERFEVRSPQSIADELNLNLISPLVLTRVLLPLVRQAQRGRIINTVSLGGIFPLPETSIYSASKFGLRGAMLCLGLEAERLGIEVGSVLPSATETPGLMKEAIEGGNTLQFIDPPQSAQAVARQVSRMLDKPKLERYPRLSESWTVRFAMLFPNLLPRLIPLFRKKGERGHERYVQSLRARGLAVEVDGKLQLRLPA